MMERMRTEAHPHRNWEALNNLESSDHLKIPETSKSD